MALVREGMKLSEAIRRDTWSDHAKAEHSDFEVALVRGMVTPEVYKELMAQSWYFYAALEERSEELKDHPVAGPVIFPELYRLKNIEQDLVHFYGPDWRDEIKPLPVTERYADRIRSATPARFVAHHYTRYLADLSGGLMIYGALKKAWNTEDGLAYYQFPDIPDPVAFKQQYRQILDDLPASREELREILDEAMVAYALNIELVEELGKRLER